MNPRPPLSNDQALGRGLVAAFVLLILSFLSSTLFALHLSDGISAAADSIATNAAPSILTIASARTELRRVQVELDNYVDKPEAPPSEAQAIRRSLQALDENLERYYALPYFPGERALWPPVDDQRRALHAVILRTLDLVATDHVGAQRLSQRDVMVATDRLDDALNAVSRFNAAQAADLGREIAWRRERGKISAVALDLLSTAFGLLLLVLLVRSFRQYTRLLQAQQRSLEARADELNDFSSRVAHDILGPLAALALALDMAEKDAREPPVKSLLARGQRSLKRVRAIVDGLYEFARAGARPLPGSRSDAQAVLADLVDDLHPLAAEAGIELRFEPEAPGEVACSVGVLCSIAGNLARNAIKYMGEGPLRRITLRLLDTGSALRLEVQDTGPGVPAALKEVLFEPHARAPGATQPGLGLGLATVKRLATAHGGAVGVESEPGQGSCFWVELPKFQARASATSDTSG